LIATASGARASDDFRVQALKAQTDDLEHPATPDSPTRRRQTLRETKRCFKGIIARQIYRRLQQHPAATESIAETT
jgi:hypothetical protein